jgi:hypothetical protein
MFQGQLFPQFSSSRWSLFWLFKHRFFQRRVFVSRLRLVQSAIFHAVSRSLCPFALSMLCHTINLRAYVAAPTYSQRQLFRGLNFRPSQRSSGPPIISVTSDSFSFFYFYCGIRFFRFIILFFLSFLFVPQALRFQRTWKIARHSRKLILPQSRRGAGVAEQGCLLSSYTPKGCRGFESPPLRHSFNFVSTCFAKE